MHPLRSAGGRAAPALSIVAVLAACSAAPPDEAHPAAHRAGTGGGGGPATTSTTASGSGEGAGGELGLGAGAPTGSGDCISLPDEDKDHDGWTVAQGDCNDCDPNANPAAVEVIADDTAVDEDCDGVIDDVPLPCDDSLDLA